MHVGNVYALNSIVSLLLMALIYGRIIVSAEQEAIDRPFIRMLIFCIMFCVVDAMWGLCYSGVMVGRGVYIAVGYCYHLLSSFSAFVWMMYVLQFTQRSKTGVRVLKIIGTMLLICQLSVIAYNIVAVPFGVVTDASNNMFVFTVNEDGIYAIGFLRTALYLLQYAYYIVILISGGVLYMNSDDEEERGGYTSAMLFSVVPLLFGVLQYVFFDAAMYSLGFSFTAAIIYMFRQTYKERDFVEHKHAEVSREHLSIITALAGDFYAIYYVDEETGSYDRFNRRRDNSDDLRKTEMPNKDFFDEAVNYGRHFIADDDQENFMLTVTRENLLKRLAESSVYSVIYRTIINGRTRYCQYSMVRDSHEGKKHLILAIYDIDEEHRRKLRQQEELRETLEQKTALEQEASLLDAAAHRDIMTGLFNRRAYEDHMHEYGGQSDSDDFVVMSFDLNGLKAVNDDIGHEAGDELIKGAAFCMKRCFGAYGRVYRHGGDEFSAMLHASEEELKAACEHFEATLSNWKGKLVDGLSVSYGAAFAKDSPGASIDELEKAADKIMYDNKMSYYARKGIDRRGQQEAYEVLRRSYIKVLKADLRNDTFSIIKTDENELDDAAGFSDKLSVWLHTFAEAGNVHESDMEEYLKRTNINYLREFFKDPSAVYMLRYRRRVTGESDNFHETMMEMIRSKDYSEDRQIVFLYVKRIDGDKMYMTLQDLTGEDELAVRITWENDVMEFASKLVRSDRDGIYIEPKMHGANPLRLSVTASDSARCSLYAASSSIGGRIVWHDAELRTLDDSDGRTLYFVSTRMFNRYSRPGERRFFERSPSGISARLAVAGGRLIDIVINDISGNGMSFSLARQHSGDADSAACHLSEGDSAEVSFFDVAGGDTFEITEEVCIVRQYAEHGIPCFGCRFVSPTDELKLYVFIAGLEKSRAKGN